MNEQKAHKTIIGTVHNKKGQLYNDIACLDVFVCLFIVSCYICLNQIIIDMFNCLRVFKRDPEFYQTVATRITVCK